MKSPPNVLTIAGSDSGGGAGIQADLKSFSANGVYGASVITALTAQNTLGVAAIHDVPVDFINEQLSAVFTDIRIDAVKIGMLSQIPVIETVAASLQKFNAGNLVLDPVMVATSGDLLIADEAVDAVRDILVPLVGLVTPNLHEAAKLTGTSLATTPEQQEKQAGRLLDSGAKAVLLKGGHGSGKQSSDLFLSPETKQWFHAPRVATTNTHGTGCSLSAAVAAQLAHGLSPVKAVAQAKTWLTGAIKHSEELDVGKGAGPVHHFHELWR